MESLWRAGSPPVSGTPFVADAQHDVVVVGAGITGLSTALMLARAGMDVAVLDAGEVGELATGGNTGKVSLLQGSVLSTLRRHHPASLVRAYVDANRAGQEWLLGFAEQAGVGFTRRTAYTYAQTSAEASVVSAELEVARDAGLDVRRADPDALGVPFPVASAVALADQVAIDPMRLARALAEQFVAAGGTLHTGVRVTRARALPYAHVDTDAGALRGDHVVLATATPIADRGLYFAKTRGLRSYAVSFDVDEPVPEGMFLSVDAPTRSVRSVTTDDGPAAGLVVGGNGHPVGRAQSPHALIDDLVRWTRVQFPSARETHRWSAQDYESHDLIPFVGAMPRGLGRIRFATGYGKWGLTNAPWAALRLSAEILGTPWRDRPAWMVAIGTRLTVPADIGRGAKENAGVAAAAVKGWTDAASRRTPVRRPAEGSGVVATRGVRPVGVSTVDGHTRAVSAVCTHLGGVLSWNDAECTWDCPLHASRFAPDGTRIEGPAVEDLRELRHPHPGGDGPESPASEAHGRE